MDLSIIIVSWRVKELLEQCLASIFRQSFDFSYEVIVIDNNSGDGTVEMVEADFSQVQLVKSQINLGFARANNLGLKRAVGRYLLLLNPDTRLLDNSLNQAVKFMSDHKNCGVLGAKLLNPDFSLQPSVRRFPRLIDHCLMMFKLHHLIPLNRYLASDFDYQKQQTVDQVMGAFFMISRNLLEKIGWLDEGYYLWFEEVDYCQRARQASFIVNYFPEIKVIHYGGQSFNQVWGFKNHWRFSLSRFRYFKKYHSLLAYMLILVLTPVSLALSLLNFKHVK